MWTALGILLGIVMFSAFFMAIGPIWVFWNRYMDWLERKYRHGPRW